MIYTLRFIIDYIFPPTVHELLLRSNSTERFIKFYHPKEVNNVVCLSEYKLPVVKAAIAACKFEHNYKTAKLLGALLTKHLSTLPPKRTLIIPIPLSRRRKSKRGFNQVERVLSHLDKLPYKTTISTNLLKRTIDTKPQTSLSRNDRLKNIESAFKVNRNDLFYLDNIERVIICDDVLTTGATLDTARAILAPHLPSTIELLVIAWAH